MRADEQHPAAAVAEARVGVQEVRGAVQRDDGLAGARTAVDDERAADPARMMASWSAAMVPSTSRIRADRLLPRLAMNADWSSSAPRAREALGGEHLVPVVVTRPRVQR